MKTIADAITKAAEFVTTMPTGRKLEPPPRGITIGGRCLGPASDVPNTTTPIGTVGGLKIEAPPDNPNRERPSVWTDLPSWMVGERW